MSAKPVPKLALGQTHQVIANPVDLKAKALRLTPEAAEAKLRTADAVVADLAGDFEEKLAEDLDELDRLMLVWAVDRRDRNLEPMHAILHNLRGQAATFGYDLITATAASFDRYMQERKADRPVSVELVRQHVEAVRAMHRNAIRGNGDPTSQAIVRALNAATDAVTGRKEA